MEKFWRTCWERSSRLRLGDRFGLVRCEEDWCWDPPRFTDWDIWICLGGSGEMRINDSVYPVTGGFSVCFPPGQWAIHASHDARRPLSVFYCHFHLEPPPHFAPPRPPYPEPVLLETDPLLWSTVRELTGSIERDRHRAIQENLLWQLLLRREQEEPHPSTSAEDRVHRIIRQIRESPAQAHPVDQLARQAAMSTGHFRRVFQKLTGCPPVQYILRCRIERAAYYLKETRLPIHRVATAVGYSDVYFFSRQFKERTGMSPSIFRRRAR